VYTNPFAHPQGQMVLVPCELKLPDLLEGGRGGGMSLEQQLRIEAEDLVVMQVGWVCCAQHSLAPHTIILHMFSPSALIHFTSNHCAKPQTPNPKPQTPNPKPQTPNPKPQTPNPKPQTPNPHPQTMARNNQRFLSVSVTAEETSDGNRGAVVWL